MSLLNQKNNKDKKKGDKKNNAAGNAGSKFIQRPKSTGFCKQTVEYGLSARKLIFCFPITPKP